jgi:site-specific recombinase XerD
MRFLEFFTANIRNPNTRRSYAKACEEFLAWCSFAGVPSIAAVQPVHVATYIEQLVQDHSTPTVKARLAAIRHLFDWLVVGQVVRVNPAASVRGSAPCGEERQDAGPVAGRSATSPRQHRHEHGYRSP